MGTRQPLVFTTGGNISQGQVSQKLKIKMLLIDMPLAQLSHRLLLTIAFNLVHHKT
jgi:hypothetical protein